MVANQVEHRGIKNTRVLESMKKVPRHLFVPEKLRYAAYEDYPLPIGYKQTISQPYIVALMTESIQPEPNDRILEIGTGSGYQAAVLSEIVKEVYTIEIVEPLAESAKLKLKKLGYSNVQVRYGDGFYGWPEVEKFDAIIITASPPKVPEPLINQLKDGGKIIVPLEEGLWQELTLFSKKNGKLERHDIIPVRFVPMTGDVQKSK